MISISPWSPYACKETISSAGRHTLVSAFGELVCSQHGFAHYDLPEIFAAPEDEGENDACRYMVQLDAALLSAQFAKGRILTFARPMGGGEIASIPADHWEIDDPLPRMATGAFNLEQWADAEAPQTHRIFVDNAQFDEWLAGLKPLGTLSNRQIEEVIDPQVRAARAAASRRVKQTSVFEPTAETRAAAPFAPEAAGFGPELLTIDEVCSLIRKSRSSIYTMSADGQFPDPLKLGSSSRWIKQEVLTWIEEQAARRGTSGN